MGEDQNQDSNRGGEDTGLGVTQLCMFDLAHGRIHLLSLDAKAKGMAAQRRTSLTQLIEEGLQLRLRSSQIAIKASKRRLLVFKGHGGLVSGPKPSSNKAMLDAADDDA